MPPVPVHIAVLAVGKDAAPTQTISEQATHAGHEVVARATVTDTQQAIRAQLTRWIDDVNIDVVIVSGGIESENAGAALKPLVTQTLPGFTDLFRYLAFQEIGASAMLSNAEAAQCASTFVFVLPASAGAVKAAMDKLILPQLDSTTTPKNLVSSMPRVRNLGDDGVPVAIVKEKTASGSGLTPKSPSRNTPVPMRARQATGANVIRKIDPDKDALFDPPTKPIDVVALEQQIALSETPPNDQPTKVVDLSRLPKVPPGADPISDDTDQIALGDLPKHRRRLESEPIEPPAPSRRKIQRTEPSAVVPPPRAVKGLLPDPPAPRGPVSLPDSGHAPVAPLPSIAPVPATRTKGPTEPPAPMRAKQVSGPFAVPTVIPKSPSEPLRKAPTTPPPSGRKSPTEPPPPPPRAATGPVPTAKPPRPPTSPPPRPQTGSAPTVKPPTELPAVAAVVALPAAAKRSPTEPPPLPRAATSPPPRPPTQPPPLRSPTQPPPPRSPTQPPPRRTDSDLPLHRSTSELPEGSFNYPVRSSAGGSKILIALAALAVLALGFVVVVFVIPMLTGDSSSAPAQQPEVVAAPPADSAIVAEPIVGDPDPDITMEPTHVDSATPTPTGPTNPRPRGTPAPPPGNTKPAGAGSAVVTPAAGSGSATEPEDTVENAPNNPAPQAGDCDEVACVLAKYDRPCCEKFRPKGSDMKPRTASGLPAELDKSMVRAGIEKVKPRVVECGEKSTDKGTVRVSVSVDPDGSVSGANIVATPNPGLGECVADAMKKAEFGKSVAGGSFVYPFVF